MTCRFSWALGQLLEHDEMIYPRVAGPSCASFTLALVNRTVDLALSIFSVFRCTASEYGTVVISLAMMLACVEEFELNATVQ